jgi:hypothetical protein
MLSSSVVRTASQHNPSSFTLPPVGTTGLHPHTCLFSRQGFTGFFLPGLDSNHHPPVSTSSVVEITGMYHHVLLFVLCFQKNNPGPIRRKAHELFYGRYQCHYEKKM